MIGRIVSLVVMGCVVVAACADSSAGAPATSFGESVDTPASVVESPADSDRATVLAAATADRVLVHNSFGGREAAASVMIVDRFGAFISSMPMLEPDPDGTPLADDERAAIEGALAPTVVHWLSPAEADAFFEAARDGGVGSGPTFVVTLAEPAISGAEASVYTEVWCGGTCGTGGTQLLVHAGDRWIVNGVYGPQWIS